MESASMGGIGKGSVAGSSTTIAGIATTTAIGGNTMIAISGQRPTVALMEC